MSDGKGMSNSLNRGSLTAMYLIRLDTYNGTEAIYGGYQHVQNALH